MTESKKYITSKSKTFKEGHDPDDIAAWVFWSINKTKQKYKITITNLK